MTLRKFVKMLGQCGNRFFIVRLDEMDIIKLGVGQD
jgi:hypothetical protein